MLNSIGVKISKQILTSVLLKMESIVNKFKC